ncbi:tRNA lysidine(34) synthetase TilS [Campylobacter sp. 19-13652]|uniref:tRNA lysidine(34) synthetase TilS n=1 Tax=Campylobacter sp. 19-13652 TaxID=2840180 RepID=UPI001C7989F0|nr:tRNA lysidine(34) synthetase TilS [Campylobacter sp. 19-13652]BCX79724.1 hypothetical protein LBC_11860 [Campylobacter sp. 19-13652]
MKLTSQTKPSAEFLRYAKGGKNLLAFSHGVDSTALFYLLLLWGVEFDLAIVDYGVRSQSKHEVAAARALADKFNKRIFVRNVSVSGGDFENKARAIRYEFFAQLVLAHGYTNLITAHQLNDRFEWLLMRLARGAGLAEMLGMNEVGEFYPSDYLLSEPLSHDKTHSKPSDANHNASQHAAVSADEILKSPKISEWQGLELGFYDALNFKFAKSAWQDLSKKQALDFEPGLNQAKNKPSTTTKHHDQNKADASQPEAKIHLLRPLLHVSRDEILGFLHANGLHYFKDASNSDFKFERNRLRAEFASGFIGRFGSGVARSFELLGADAKHLAPELRRLGDSIIALKADANAMRGISLALKKFGLVLSAKQRDELSKDGKLKSGVIGGKIAVGVGERELSGWVIITPYLSQSKAEITLQNAEQGGLERLNLIKASHATPQKRQNDDKSADFHAAASNLNKISATQERKPFTQNSTKSNLNSALSQNKGFYSSPQKPSNTTKPAQASASQNQNMQDSQKDKAQISSQKKEQGKMSKEFKEKCRTIGIPPLNRAFLYQMQIAPQSLADSLKD